MAFVPKNYWQERLQGSFSLTGVGFMSLGPAFNKWMYRLRHHVFLDTVRSLGLDLAKCDVLDIGSGTGFYIERWKELGVHRVNGYDITDVSVNELSRKHPGSTFKQVDIGEPGLAVEAVYDLASCIDVLYHIIDDERFAAALKNIGRSLKPGGRFIWSDNFLHGATVRGESQVNRALVDTERMLSEAGFTIESRRPVFVLMNTPIDIKARWVAPLWQKVMRQVTRTTITGEVAGALFYLADRILIERLSESPTTEIMVCRKTG